MTPFFLNASTTASLHRPRSRGAKRSLGLVVQTRVLPPDHHCPKPKSDRLGRRAQMVREGLITGLVTLLLTSVAVASPATLQQSPLTTMGSIQQRWMPMGAADGASAMVDCP